MVHQHKYDVVIVGAGGAGMRAALEAGQRTRTAVLTKLYPTRSHTGAAQGGMCAALANVEEDNWEWHTFDTVKGGDYLVDQDAAEVMAREAIDAVLDLEKMGLPFNRTDEGRIDQRRFGGHTRNHGEAAVRRSCYAADRTGHMILQTLYQQCIKHDVEFYNEFYVLDLVMTDGRASGVVAYELATGEIHVFNAKAVIFATGGFGKVFRTTSNAHTLTGDGMGIVWRKGLPLEDMEFFQFHPNGLAGLGGPGVRRARAAAGAGAHQQVEDVELVVELDALLGAVLVERLQDHVAGAVGGEARAADRGLTVVAGVAAEPTLVDLALRGAVERQPHLLEVDDRVDRLAAHDLGSVLVDEVVAALDGVEGVPLPVVLLDVGEGGAHAALGRAGVGPGGVELGQHRGAGALARLERCPHARAARSDDDDVVLVRLHLCCSLLRVRGVRGHRVHPGHRPHTERVEFGSRHGSKVKMTSVPSTIVKTVAVTSRPLRTHRVRSFSV
jgi:flavin-dependent dehydrogenase